MASKWGDLTDKQKERLVAISRGEQSGNNDDDYWCLVTLGLIKWVTVEMENIDYLTPAGGALLAERDKLRDAVIDAAEAMVIAWASTEAGTRIKASRALSDAVDALAAAKERGE